MQQWYMLNIGHIEGMAFNILGVGKNLVTFFLQTHPLSIWSRFTKKCLNYAKQKFRNLVESPLQMAYKTG